MGEGCAHGPAFIHNGQEQEGSRLMTGLPQKLTMEKRGPQSPLWLPTSCSKGAVGELPTVCTVFKKPNAPRNKKSKRNRIYTVATQWWQQERRSVFPAGPALPRTRCRHEHGGGRTARGCFATRCTIVADTPTTSFSWQTQFLDSSGRTGSYFRKPFFLFNIESSFK